MPRLLDAAVLGPVPAATRPTPAISGTTALDRSLVFIARMSFVSLVVPHPTRVAELVPAEIAEPISEYKIPTLGGSQESLVVTYS